MGREKEILDEFRRLKADELMPMLRSGQVALISEKNNKTQGVMSAQLVETTLEEAWKVLLDYGAYQRFLPGIQESRVLSRRENEIVVRFVAAVKVMGVGGTIKYTYRFDINRPYADVYDAARGNLTGYWAILPIAEKEKVILVHADVAKDIRSTHIFLRFLVEKLPTAEVGLNVAPVCMLVSRVRQRMEQLGAAGGGHNHRDRGRTGRG